MSTPDVELLDVRKEYAGFVAVQGCTLSIAQGEFVSLLGPSGCGKTTTLNLIAGFLDPTRGRVRIRGTDVTNVPPNKRNLGMVFQNYALFPHMTVAENVAFGLKMKGVGASETRQAVGEALALTHMESFAERYPRQLSGGQQQRVALARAIAPKPTVLLLDEPLSNLDLKLREAMRRELKQLQRELGITAIFVTHDQDEALTMSDRVVVMRAGAVEQLGTPADIYARPLTRFVAGFVGQMNFFEATVTQMRGEVAMAKLPGDGGEIRLRAPAGTQVGQVLNAGVRPENIRLRPPGPPLLDGVLEELVQAGAVTQAMIRLPSQDTMRVDLLTGTLPEGMALGATVGLAIPADKVILLQDAPP